MQRRSVLVHDCRRLGAAVATRAVEIHCVDAVLTERAFECSAAIHRFRCVKSHLVLSVRIGFGHEQRPLNATAMSSIYTAWAWKEWSSYFKLHSPNNQSNKIGGSRSCLGLMQAAEQEVTTRPEAAIGPTLARRTNQAFKVVQCDQTSVLRHFYHEGSEEVRRRVTKGQSRFLITREVQTGKRIDCSCGPVFTRWRGLGILSLA
jgi:hypothetical protein